MPISSQAHSGFGYFFMELFIANYKRYKNFDRAARRTLDTSGNAIEKISTSQQPFINDRMDFIADVSSIATSMAVLEYKFRRIRWHSMSYEAERGNYFIDLLIDIAILIFDIVWGFVSMVLHTLMMLLIYSVVIMGLFLLVMYMLFGR